MTLFRASSYAEQDLRSIFRYTIESWGVAQAAAYLQLISLARDRIVSNPCLPGSKSREDLAEGCRTYRCGKHVIFYRLRDNAVEIARILHESMDFPKHVGETSFD
jgi:toxin ParE1/3/4